MLLSEALPIDNLVFGKVCMLTELVSVATYGVVDVTALDSRPETKACFFVWKFILHPTLHV